MDANGCAHDWVQHNAWYLQQSTDLAVREHLERLEGLLIKRLAIRTEMIDKMIDVHLMHWPIGKTGAVCMACGQLGLMIRRATMDLFVPLS